MEPSPAKQTEPSQVHLLRPSEGAGRRGVAPFNSIDSYVCKESGTSLPIVRIHKSYDPVEGPLGPKLQPLRGTTVAIRYSAEVLFFDQRQSLSSQREVKP